MPSNDITITEKITIDTGVLITLIDAKDRDGHATKILEWVKQGRVQAFVSNRILEPDAKAMRTEGQKALRDFIHENRLRILGSVARFGVSSLDGHDLLGGGRTDRTPTELLRFKVVVGQNPTHFPSGHFGKNLSNHIGDYDALFDHYCDKSDYFITLDSKGYLHRDKRLDYQQELGLNVVSPEEYCFLHPFW